MRHKGGTQHAYSETCIANPNKASLYEMALMEMHTEEFRGLFGEM